MQAVLVNEETREVSIGEAPKPVPKPHEILIRVYYTACNRADLMQVCSNLQTIFVAALELNMN